MTLAELEPALAAEQPFGVARVFVSVYQVNLVRHMRAPFSGDPVGFAQSLAHLRPLDPAVLEGDGWALMSASPELLLQKRGRTIRTCPIEGTRPAGVRVEAVLPGGSVTGCPKLAALELIAALGRVYGNGNLDLALTVRTFASVDGEIHFWVGGGTVWGSVADDEIEESWVKARPLIAL